MKISLKNFIFNLLYNEQVIVAEIEENKSVVKNSCNLAIIILY